MIDVVMIELLRTTGAARRFLADRVEPAVVHQILDDARFAPSGGNRQPWKVAVVEDLALRREIASMMQGVWDDYKARPAGITPYNVVDDVVPDSAPHVDYELLDSIAEIPVVLAVAADLRRIALMDRDLARVPVTGGASIYPFCWSILLSARSRGLGGVMTTFLSRVEPAAAPVLGLPEHHALVATIFLGVPEHVTTKLSREPVEHFTTVDRFDGEAFTPTVTPLRTSER
jgi:nitroreductase